MMAFDLSLFILIPFAVCLAGDPLSTTDRLVSEVEYREDGNKILVVSFWIQ
jgi:hypothetical protein